MIKSIVAICLRKLSDALSFNQLQEKFTPGSLIQVIFPPDIPLESLPYYFSFFRNGANKSIGKGKIMVEFFSVAISVSVCKKRS